MSGMDFQPTNHSDTGIHPADNGTFLRFPPTAVSASAAAGSSRPSGADVYVYVWIFLCLLVFLLTLLVVTLRRLKNVITSSSSVPDCSSSETASSFTNVEICSVSSQKSTVSTLSK